MVAVRRREIALALLLVASAACGARTSLRDTPGDAAVDAVPLPIVRCPPGSGVTCARGETCCATTGCPVQYACTSASACPALDFNSSRPGMGCDEREDCPGAQCCAVPFTNVTAAGMCTAWATGCRTTCSDGTSATGVPGGRLCAADGDCADLGRRCCVCRGSPVGVCLTDCTEPACANAP